MSKMIEIDIGGKPYFLGYPTRRDVKRAEEKGLNIAKLEDKIITLQEKLFYTGLLAKQPDIKEKEAEDLLNQYADEGGDLGEITKFLSEAYSNFIVSQDGKAKKKAKIVALG